MDKRSKYNSNFLEEDKRQIIAESAPCRVYTIKIQQNKGAISWKMTRDRVESAT